MAPRPVDVEIRGKNTTGKAFKDAGGEIDSFVGRVQKAVHPLNLLKGVIAGLGIASFGAILRKSTEAAIEHEKSLGRNVSQLNKLSAAWDYVLVKIGQSILGMDKAGGFTDRATTALAGFGDWIENNKSNIEDFAGLLLDIAGAMGTIASFAAKPLLKKDGQYFGAGTHLGDLFGGSGSDRAGGAGRSYGTGFDTFMKERDEAAKRKLAEEESKRAAKSAADAAKREQERIQEEFNKKIVPMMGNGSTSRAGILSTGIGTIGATPTLSAIGDPAALDVGTQKFSELQLAVGSLTDSLTGTAKDAIVGFADTWADATQEMIGGTLSLGDAIVKSTRKAIGGSLMAKGRETLLDAAKAAVMGFTNPVEFVKAAKLLAVGTAQMAAGQLFAGGGGGGGGSAGGLGGGSFNDQRNDMNQDRGTTTWVIKGGSLFDTKDPENMDAFAEMFRQATGQRLIIIHEP